MYCVKKYEIQFLCKLFLLLIYQINNKLYTLNNKMTFKIKYSQIEYKSSNHLVYGGQCRKNSESMYATVTVISSLNNLTTSFGSVSNLDIFA